MNEIWEKKVKEYCEKYNIPLIYLADTLYEPKVVPMIRGKAFEFSVMLVLQKILPNSEWIVDKQMMNAQTGFHDIDVRVLHKPTNKVIRVECKLAKKGGFRLFEDGHSEIRVKCMRSRTLGTAKVKSLAPKFGVTEKVLSVHNDQYLPADFDVVITSIGNAFYDTDKKTNLFEWKPTQEGEKFLKKLGAPSNEMQEFAFNTMFIARAEDLTIGHNGIMCTRGKCKNKKGCGFIPNYPIITFDKKNNQPKNSWLSINDSAKIFKQFV